MSETIDLGTWNKVSRKPGRRIVDGPLSSVVSQDGLLRLSLEVCAKLGKKTDCYVKLGDEGHLKVALRASENGWSISQQRQVACLRSGHMRGYKITQGIKLGVWEGDIFVIDLGNATRVD